MQDAEQEGSSTKGRSRTLLKQWNGALLERLRSPEVAIRYASISLLRETILYFNFSNFALSFSQGRQIMKHFSAIFQFGKKHLIISLKEYLKFSNFH